MADNIKQAQADVLLGTVRDWSKGKFVQKETGKGLSTNDYDATEKGHVADAVTHMADTDIHVTTQDKSGWNAKYDLPDGGIPKSDLASAVQTSLGLANTALQSSALTPYRTSSDQDTIDDAIKNRVTTLEGKTELSDFTDDLGETPVHTHKTYQDQIDALKSIGRFLAIWNCSTGLPLTNPTSLPYAYKTGDYYRVGQVAGGYVHTITMSGTDYSSNAYSVSFAITNNVSTQYDSVASIITALYNAGHVSHSGTCAATGILTDHETSEARTLGYVASDGTTALLLQDATTSAIGSVLSGATATITDTVTGGSTNYKPEGSSYTGAASTTVETEDVQTGWVYYFDGTTWLPQAGSAEAKVVDVQAEGASVLNSATGVANVTKQSLGLNKVDNTSDLEKPISTATQTALDAKVAKNSDITGGTKCKVTYDSKGLVTAGDNLAASDLPDNHGDTKNPYASKTANYVLAAPNGSAGSPSFRALVTNDISDMEFMTAAEMQAILNEES